MEDRNLNTDWVFMGLVCCFIIVMIPLSIVDFSWTLYVHENQHPFLGDFMKRTLFDSGKFGASDPAVFLILVIAVAYFINNPQKKISQLGRYRPQLGFVLTSALITSLGLVHSLKIVVGRARPDMVLKHNYPYTKWYEFGAQFVADGFFYGSFPSGHTAGVFMLMSFSYILIFDPTKSFKFKIAGWIWGGLTLIYTSLMIVGRSMTLDHWLSDSIGITLMCWMSIHLLFFYVFKIPQQLEYINRHHAYPALSRYWEFKILWRLLILTLCVMSNIIGFRAVWIQRFPYLVLAVIPAIVVFYLLSKNLRKVYIESMSHF